MSYVRGNLQNGEVLVYQTRLHWIVYGRAIFWAVLAIIAGAVAFSGRDQGHAGAFDIVASIRRVSTELAVTDRRVIAKVGFIRRRTVEMNRSKIELVRVDQGIMGRLFDFGTITIEGTGGGIEPLVGIDGPIKFRNHVTAG
jgi:uncharacterized membrane protein YdbT with pleckstrin-like domain